MEAGLVLAAAASASAAAALATSAAHAVWRRKLGLPPDWFPAVLAYHKVGSAELGGTWCTRRQFAAHLDALCAAGFLAIDSVRLASRLYGEPRPGSHTPADTHEKAAPVEVQSDSREVLVTFDDAYDSFAAHAFPELRARGFPVVLFVIAGFVGRRSGWDLPLPGRRAAHLDWAALRDLVCAGVEIGSHTMTHRDLRRLTVAELSRELAGSRRQLEDVLGVEVRAVSYPFGRFDGRVLDAAAAAGYRFGFSMCPPGSNASILPLALRRWGVYVTDTPRSVLDKVDPTRRAFWIQDLVTRGVSAVAELAAVASPATAARAARRMHP